MWLLNKYALLWSSINNYTKLEEKVHVSLVIPFRNEENHLTKLVASLNELDLSNIRLDVIWIDDHSTDDSVSVVENGVFKHPSTVLKLEESTGKKSAIKLAWKNVKADIIVQTDADCVLPTNWLQKVLAPFNNEGVEVVSAPVKFTDNSTFWHKLVALDFAGLIGIGAAHIAWQNVLIANGANLAYRKSTIKSLDLNERRASGDDVFLVQSIGLNNPAAIKFVKHNDATVLTEGPASFTEFWNQRLRWAGKNAEFANTKHKLVLGGVWLYNLLILVLLLVAKPVTLTCAGFLVLLKVLSEDKFYRALDKDLNLGLYFKTLLLGQPFHIVYMALMPIASQIFKYHWKERLYK